MTKDGTTRGGNRTGSGRKGRTAVQKILDGAKQRSMSLELIDEEDSSSFPELPSWAVERQQTSIKVGDTSIETPSLQTEKVFKCVWSFLDGIGVTEDVGLHLIQLYAFEVARFIQSEQITSLIGFTVPHPTTGAPMASPFVNASMNYLKQANILWSHISQVVRDKWEGASSSPTKGNDMMEYLLTHNPKVKGN